MIPRLLAEGEVVEVEIPKITFYSPRYRLPEGGRTLLVKVRSYRSVGEYFPDRDSWELECFDDSQDVKSKDVELWAYWPDLG